MDRRTAILSGAALAALPARAEAQAQCTGFNMQGVQECMAGIPSIALYQARQACPQWCWAASIQMIFARSGRLVDQREIVRRLFSDERCQPATGPQIVYAASGSWVDSNGRRFSAKAYPIADFTLGLNNYNAGAEAAQHLAAGKPLINGALSHATVMTAMTYMRDMQGRGMVTSITVRDPWPGNPPRRVLTPQEVAGSNVLIAINVW